MLGTACLGSSSAEMALRDIELHVSHPGVGSSESQQHLSL